MKLPASILAIALGALPCWQARAANVEGAGNEAASGGTTADGSPAMDECKQAERDKGHGEKTSEVVCAAKTAFQNRIRRKKELEPVEMTVGSPPMQTDDTDTPGPNNWEVNIVASGAVSGSEHRIEAPTLDVNYGVGESVQLTYELPYVFLKERSDSMSAPEYSSASGIGDSKFGVKYRFYDNDESGLSFAIYPQIEFRTPGASRRISEGSTELILPILMTREFEHASISANAGVELSDGDRRYFASFGAGRRLSDHVALLAEIVGTDLNAADEKRALLNVGLKWKVSDTQSLSGSLGRDVYAGGDQRESNYFSLAYQKQFGG